MTARLLVILFLSISSLSVGQIGDLRIYDGNNYKCNLHQLNDSLVYLTFEEFYGFSSYYLGKFELSEDSLVINEVLERVVIKSDVYYSNEKSVPEDSIMVEYLDSDFIIPTGFFSHDTATFKVEKNIYKTSNGKNEGSVQALVKRPGNQKLKINISDKFGSLLQTEVEIPEKFNKIQFKEYSVFSLPAYQTETFQELIPADIEIDGKKLKLAIQLN